MKKLLMALSVLAVGQVCKGQDTTQASKPCQYVVVNMATPDKRYVESYIRYCDGHKESLKDLLTAHVKNDWINEDDHTVEEANEIKMLEYMAGKGYELLSIAQYRPYLTRQFYFKHR